MSGGACRGDGAEKSVKNVSGRVMRKGDRSLERGEDAEVSSEVN